MSLFSAILEGIVLGAPILSHEDAETHEVGNLIFKIMVLPKGAAVIKHVHSYTHAHILGKGRIMLEIDDKTVEYVAPAVIEIQANKHHGIIALEDSVGFCVHDKTQLGV
jgi:quercetin dioxygenase-like cupin family protein